MFRRIIGGMLAEIAAERLVNYSLKIPRKHPTNVRQIVGQISVKTSDVDKFFCQ